LKDAKKKLSKEAKVPTNEDQSLVDSDDDDDDDDEEDDSRMR
jgi:hypothetical protein